MDRNNKKKQDDAGKDDDSITSTSNESTANAGNTAAEFHPSDKTGMASDTDETKGDPHFKADDAASQQDRTKGSRTEKHPKEGTVFETSSQAEKGFMDLRISVEKPKDGPTQE